ncbi:MAG: TetR/AcrR family transcriptional regulator [Candidatus Nanopelagicales bacterium]
MGYRHSREQLLDAATGLALDEGLGALTFGRVADRLGIADRTVVYYFPTKTALETAVVTALSVRLQALLHEAFGDEPQPVGVLARRAWPVLAHREADPVFSVFFQVVGRGAAGEEPYVELSASLVEGWVAWLEPLVAEPTREARRSAALALMAQLDGLLLIRLVGGARRANTAARRLGVLV